jgi:hypothetical protein
MNRAQSFATVPRLCELQCKDDGVINERVENTLKAILILFLCFHPSKETLEFGELML